MAFTSASLPDLLQDSATNCQVLRTVLDTLADIAALDLDPQTVMQAITERTCAFSGADGASLELLDGDDLICQSVTGLTAPYQGVRFSTESSLSGCAVKEGRALCCADSETDPRVHREGCRQVGARSIVVVPLPHNGRIIGTLKVLARAPGAFSQTHIDGLTLMAGLLAAAMSHATEFEAKKALLIDRTRALAALREGEERFRSAFEFAAIGMALVALDGRWMQVNRSMCEIVGYTEAELLATNFQAITHPEDLDADLDYVRRLIAGDQRSYQLTKRYFHKDGHTVWVLLSVSLVRGEGNQPLYFISQVQDITERKRAERMVATHRAVLEMVAHERPVDQIMQRLAAMAEDHLADAHACFLILEDGDISITAPNLPPGMLHVMRQRPLTVAAGLCGNVEPGRRPKQHNFTADGLWDPFRHAALGVDIRGCWALPIDAPDGAPMGVLAIFIRHPAGPTTFARELCDTIAQLASLALHRRQMNEQLSRRAQHDPLTGLPNRALFADRLDQALASAQRNGGSCALFLLDLDNFKSVNDTDGHDAGDRLLQQFAQRMGGLLRESDTLARFGGDEFAVILPHLKCRHDAVKVAKKILTAFHEPFQLPARSLHATTSIGIALYPADARDADSLRKSADAALYRVKARGRNGYDDGEQDFEF